MRNAVLWSLALVLVGVSTVAAAGLELTNDEQKTFYALGLAVSRSLAPFNLTEGELELVKAGLADGVLHKEQHVAVFEGVHQHAVGIYAGDVAGDGLAAAEPGRLGDARSSGWKLGRPYDRRSLGPKRGTETDDQQENFHPVAAHNIIL